MKKKLLTIILVLALSMTVVVAFTACDLFGRGGNGTGGNGGDVPRANYDYFYIEDNNIIGLTQLGRRQTTFVIPASVKEINSHYGRIYAWQRARSPFEQVESDNQITIQFEPNSNLEYIGPAAFMNLSSLKSITIPANVRRIGRSAFLRASGLASVEFEEGSRLEHIGDSAFSQTSLTSIIIPESVTIIGEAAFRATSLMSINIPNTVTAIGAFAFSNTTSLLSINIPPLITRISAGTFLRASSLTSIIIPESVTVIGADAFNGATSLASITIPATIVNILHHAFAYWTNEQTIYVEGRSEEPSNGNWHSWLMSSNANVVWLG
ncbi:MAG: leucine-rich repeat domain-containing protein [Firmicutes bacterium]|nr:leucine-rich repeat domain-containing protein [Bacillota bacterium]